MSGRSHYRASSVAPTQVLRGMEDRQQSFPNFILLLVPSSGSEHVPMIDT
jgi:hypothetical protein